MGAEVSAEDVAALVEDTENYITYHYSATGHLASCIIYSAVFSN